jgi:hypothetical protein
VDLVSIRMITDDLERAEHGWLHFLAADAGVERREPSWV